jgi:hypothetical protein
VVERRLFQLPVLAPNENLGQLPHVHSSRHSLASRVPQFIFFRTQEARSEQTYQSPTIDCSLVLPVTRLLCVASGTRQDNARPPKRTPLARRWQWRIEEWSRSEQEIAECEPENSARTRHLLTPPSYQQNNLGLDTAGTHHLAPASQTEGPDDGSRSPSGPRTPAAVNVQDPFGTTTATIYRDDDPTSGTNRPKYYTAIVLT